MDTKKILEKNGNEITVRMVKNLEKVSGGNVDIKELDRITTIDGEEIILSRLEAELESIQFRVNEQKEFIKKIKSL